MSPSDWVADCMVPDAWLHQPFALEGDAVACDGSALVAFPGRAKDYGPLKFDDEQNLARQLMAVLRIARLANTTPIESVKELGLNEQHTTRLAAVSGLQTLNETNRILFQVLDPTTGEMTAYGVIYKGAQAA